MAEKSNIKASSTSAIPWPSLVPAGSHEGKAAIPLMRPAFVVGSRHNAHLHLLSRSISKAHAIFVTSNNGVYVRDLASRTGVIVNGKAVREAVLENGDLVKLGSFTFKYRAAAGIKQRPRADATPDAVLEVTGADFPIPIDSRVVLVGRRPTCDISLVEESVSTSHCVIFSMNQKRYVRDLGSRTGTWVNGKKEHQAELRLGDELRVGDTIIRYAAPAAVAANDALLEDLDDLAGTAPLPPEHSQSAPARPQSLAGSSIPLADEPDFIADGAKSEPLPLEAGEMEHPAHEEGEEIPEPSARDLDGSDEQEPAPSTPTLLAGNLLSEKLSSSATGAGMEAAARGAGGRGDRPSRNLKNFPRSRPVGRDRVGHAAAETPPLGASSDEPLDPDRRAHGDDIAELGISDDQLDLEHEAAAIDAGDSDGSAQPLSDEQTDSSNDITPSTPAESEGAATGFAPQSPRPTPPTGASQSGGSGSSRTWRTWFGIGKRSELDTPVEGKSAAARELPAASESAAPSSAEPAGETESESETESAAGSRSAPDSSEARLEVAGAGSIPPAADIANLDEVAASGDEATASEIGELRLEGDEIIAAQPAGPEIDEHAERETGDDELLAVLEQGDEADATPFDAAADLMESGREPAESAVAAEGLGDASANEPAESAAISDRAGAFDAMAMRGLGDVAEGESSSESLAGEVLDTSDVLDLEDLSAEPLPLQSAHAPNEHGSALDTPEAQFIELSESVAASTPDSESPATDSQSVSSSNSGHAMEVHAPALQTPPAMESDELESIDLRFDEAEEPERAPAINEGAANFPAGAETSQAPSAIDSPKADYSVTDAQLHTAKDEDAQPPMELPRHEDSQPHPEESQADAAPATAPSISNKEEGAEQAEEPAQAPAEVPAQAQAEAPAQGQVEKYNDELNEAAADQQHQNPTERQVSAASVDKSPLPTGLPAPREEQATAAPELGLGDERNEHDEPDIAAAMSSEGSAGDEEMVELDLSLEPLDVEPIEDDLGGITFVTAPTSQETGPELSSAPSGEDEPAAPDSAAEKGTADAAPKSDPSTVSTGPAGRPGGAQMHFPGASLASADDAHQNVSAAEPALIPKAAIEEDVEPIETPLESSIEPPFIEPPSERPPATRPKPSSPPAQDGPPSSSQQNPAPSASAHDENRPMDVPSNSDAADGRAHREPIELEFSIHSDVISDATPDGGSESESGAPADGSQDEPAEVESAVADFVQDESAESLDGLQAGDVPMESAEEIYVGENEAPGIEITEAAAVDSGEVEFVEPLEMAEPVDFTATVAATEAATGPEHEAAGESVENSAASPQIEPAAASAAEENKSADGESPEGDPDSQSAGAQPFFVAEASENESVLSVQLPPVLAPASEPDAGPPMATLSSELAAAPQSFSGDFGFAAQPVMPAISPTDRAEPEPVAPLSPIAEAPHPSPPQVPFFGLGTDQGTFLGGLPLFLNELPPPPPTFGRVPVSFNDEHSPKAPVADAPAPKAGSSPYDRVLSHAAPSAEKPAPAAPPQLPPDQRESLTADEELARSTQLMRSAGMRAVPMSRKLRPDKPRRPGEFAAPPAKAPGKPSTDAPAGASPFGLTGAVAPATDGNFGATGAFAGAFGGMGAVRQTDVFSQGFSHDLSNDPFFGTAVKAAPSKGKKPHKGSQAITPVDKTDAAAEIAQPQEPEHPQADEPASDEDLADANDASPEAAESAVEVPRRQIRRAGLGQIALQSAVASPGYRLPEAAEAAPQATPLAPSAAIPVRRRRMHPGLLLVIMLLVMLAAFAGAYVIIKEHVVTEGVVQYQHVGALTQNEWEQVREGQVAKLQSENLRVLANGLFKSQYPSLDSGFLGDPEQFANVERLRFYWPESSEGRSGNLIVRYNGFDKTLDPWRVDALMRALVSDNIAIRESSGKLQQDLDTARTSLDRSHHELDRVKDRIQWIGAAGGTGDDAMFSVLQAAKDHAYQHYRSAMDAAIRADAEYNRIAAGIPSSAGPTSQPASQPMGDLVRAGVGAGPIASRESDPELLKLQSTLDELNKKREAAHASATANAVKARGDLDKSIEDLNQSMLAVEGLSKNTPELRDYADAAQKLLEQVHLVSGALLDHQQKMQENIIALKKSLDEHIQARRQEIWDNDPGLRQLRDDLAMRERGYNAAMEQDYVPQAAEIRKQMDGKLQEIEARKMQIGNDVIYSDVAKQLDDQIREGRTVLADDRSKTDKLLKDLEEKMSDAASPMQKLPDDQKTQMSTRVEAMNAARKRYADALEARDAQANAQLKELDDQASAMASKIDERRQQVAAQTSHDLSQQEMQQQEALLAVKKIQLGVARKAEEDALKDYDGKVADEMKASLGKTQRDVAAAELQDLKKQQDTLTQQVELQTEAVAQKSTELAKVVYPIILTNAQATPSQDNRLVGALGAAAVIAVLFSGMLFFFGFSHPHPMPVHPMDVDESGDGFDAAPDAIELDDSANGASTSSPARGNGQSKVAV